VCSIGSEKSLSDYLKKKVKQGILAIDDCEVVAAQLIEALLAPLFKPVLFNFGDRLVV